MTRFLLACAVVVGLSSCKSNSGGDFGGEDGRMVAGLVEEFDEALQRPARITEVFAAGSAPKAADLKKYRGLAFRLVGRPEVNGSAGTAKVSVHSNATGTALGEQQWTFVKEGNTWKIKSAALP